MALKTAFNNMPDKRNVYDFLVHSSPDDFTAKELDEALERYGYDPRRYLNNIDKRQQLINHFRPEPLQKKKTRFYSFE